MRSLLLPSQSSTQTLFVRLTAPLAREIESSRNFRSCPAISDPLWIELGIRRTLSTESSGRGFLQSMLDCFDQDIGVSDWFASLNSKRRLKLLDDVGETILRKMEKACPDHHNILRGIPGLDDYDIIAGDGHNLEHACHDGSIIGHQHATGHFFGIDLRTMGMFTIALGEQDSQRKCEHDMHALKRLSPRELRRDAPTGRKVLWIWDRAAVDAAFWLNAKRKHGVYLITRAKAGMKLINHGSIAYDHESPHNSGVVDFYHTFVDSHPLRCIVYQCPVSGNRFKFLTTLTALDPGTIALLYRARWTIEKTFDETKTKLGEKKSWASSSVAKQIHARFIALAHNLAVMLEWVLEFEHQITDNVNIERRAKRLREAEKRAGKKKRKIPELFSRLFSRASQRTLVFIRWLRNHLDTSNVGFAHNPSGEFSGTK